MTGKSWTLDVKENLEGDPYIELNEEILELSGFKEGDNIKFVDNLDGSMTLMHADMREYKVVSKFENPKLNRKAVVYFSLNRSDHVIDMYEKDALVHSRKITNHRLSYSEDCAENWIYAYGEFKND